EGLGVVELGDRDLGAARLPCCALRGVAHEYPNRLLLPEQRLRDDLPRIPRDPGNDEHGALPTCASRRPSPSTQGTYAARPSCCQSMMYIQIMNDVHLGAVDLNLLVALDALLDERSVTRAAARVGVTQSAMSHALARLRGLFDDALLVRGAAGMVTTD